jgi:hypothetical protein
VELHVACDKLRRIQAEEAASLQVEVSAADLANVSEDELASSYLRLVTTFRATISTQQALREDVQQLRVRVLLRAKGRRKRRRPTDDHPVSAHHQNKLILHRETERETLELEHRHAQACKGVQELQEHISRAEKYKAVSRQQHDVIRALEKTIMNIRPRLLRADTLLDSTAYKRLLAQHLLLRQKQQQLRQASTEAHDSRPTALSPEMQVSLHTAAAALQASRMKAVNLQLQLQRRQAVEGGQRSAALTARTNVTRELEALQQRKSSLEQELLRMNTVRVRLWWADDFLLCFFSAQFPPPFFLSRSTWR